MAKPLVIVESPAKARTLARLLGDEYRVEASVGHVRDLPGDASEVYNVGSGRETRLRDVLDTLLSQAGVTAAIRTDPARLRADEQLRAVADVGKIGAHTGWSASTPLTMTLQDMLDDWSKRVELE